MTTNIEARVEELKTQLLEEIQNFCRSQIDTWSQVPELAFKANSIKGFSCGRYALAYCSQSWSVFSSDIFGLWIDLRTGELGTPELLDRIQLGQLSTLLEHLCADEVVKFLQTEIDS